MRTHIVCILGAKIRQEFEITNNLKEKNVINIQIVRIMPTLFRINHFLNRSEQNLSDNVV